ncbi:specifically androgen-regulated gene protein isoform X1 [Sapajus apella]|uniref:Specifically androgen-regulated gene protein isoform X1 n=2 Tax=Sapajus apella TaxID=9515 RepID=A0A6J3IQY0_SAPAP|nr:specifically androgen-regulated gene protein isoform X1 [Sapajus apella]XP_032144936.1 specifically androgen-regulated gene protein isoform X1 [Sapajus apella]
MPERELWPAGTGSEPVTRVGSCDSMMSSTSTRSGSSDSSYDYLSAEEKECLLFLEETIGSLDTEADSGLSTDESEPATTPRGFQALPITQPTPRGGPEEIITQQGPEPKTVTEPSSSHPPEPQGLGLRSGSYSLPRNIHIARSQNFRKSTTQAIRHTPGEPVRLVPGPEKEQVSQSSEPSQAPASPREATLDLDVVLIPPPEAFRDTQTEQYREASLPEGPGQQGHAPQLHTPSCSQERQQTASKAMSQKAKETGSTGCTQQPRPPPAVLPQNVKAEDALLPSGEDPNTRLAPLTAPKPRKLPPNIVLKSSRSSFHSDPQHWLSRHTEAAPGDSGLAPSSLQEQRKARREALEKLGLPQDQDEPGLHLSKPTSSIRLKETRAQRPSPAPAQASAAIPAAGKPLVRAPAPAPAQGPLPMKSPAPGNVAATKSVPIPIPKAPRANSPPTPPKPDSALTLQESNIPGLRQMNFKSNTLERSGVGLSSYLSAEKDASPKTSTSLGKGSVLDKISPSILRNSRPRPASLGTGKDFVGIQVGKLADLEQEQSSKHLSYQGQSSDKLPRPPCVSVKISPKGVPNEHRREALKKLGLLKE